MDPNWKSTEKFILLPELKMISHWQSDKFRTRYKCAKESEFEICPKCAVKSYSVHDRRWVKVEDQPIRGSGVSLMILKRRFRCPSCKKVFTEPVAGIRKGFKTTLRFRRGVQWACENFLDLKKVQKAFNCSAGLVYKVYYEQLDLKHRERRGNPWPKTIGIDDRSNPVRKLLLMNGSRLEYFERRALHQWLDQHPRLRELYGFKEALHALYRCRGYNRAKRALINLLDRMAQSQLKEIKRLRRTLMKWKNEILNYFETGITNGRTEGFNNLAKLLQKRAFGFRSFKNYRLRLPSL